MKLVVIVTFMCEVFVHCYNIDQKFPIIYSKPKDKITERNSFFGFSLILHKDWLQVGAPRANSTILGARVMEPGVAYRCKIFGTCKEIELDRNANSFREDTMAIRDLKNHSWIGGAMAMEFGENGKVVVCGHRWKNQANLNPIGYEDEPQDSYAMSGICYISTLYDGTDHSFRYYLPPETYDRTTSWSEYYGLFHKSQMGMSLYIAPPTQKMISLLIGAPGAGVYWSGGALEYLREPTGRIEARRRRETHREEYGNYVKKGFVYKKVLSYIEQFSYFGYQVASGSFFSVNELCRVASSPRGAELRGSVVVYNVQYGNVATPKIVQYFVLEGQTFGEYFGGSLTVADVTGDGLDDLIVGAPLFTLQGDEGCIYVFTKYISFSLREKNKKIGFKVGGRFGTSVASLGDIDQDKYHDIAVGAPYEGSGVIYIYNGSPNGLSDKPSQRIKASDIHESIRGFGISISRPADIDNNKFEDIAIGSYLSEHVVLLRTYPAIELIALLSTNIKQLNVHQTKFSVSACLAYNGTENVPDGVDVVRTIEVDVEFHRFKQIPSKHIKLQTRHTPQCEEITIEMKEGAKYVSRIEDIKIVLSQRLKEKGNNSLSIIWVNGSPIPHGIDKFCRLCSVVRKNHTHTLTVPYAQDCGDDGECVSDVKLECRMTYNDTLLNTINGFVIGSFRPLLQLIVDISNHGEPLYSPKIRISIPKEVNLAQIPPTCQEDYRSESSSLTCSLGPITDGQKNVNISLDLSAFEALRSLWEVNHPLSFGIETVSAGNHRDTDETNNKCYMPLKLTMQADIRINGKSETDDLHSGADDEKREANIIHIFEVSNSEVSPVKQVQTILYVPVEWNEDGSQTRFSDTEKYPIQAHQNSKSIFCPRVNANSKNVGTEFTKGSVPEVKMEMINNSLSDSYPSNRTLYLNCSSSNVICETYKCDFFEFKIDTIAKIVISSKLNMSKLEPIMGHRDIIYFSTHGHVEIEGYENIHYPWSEMQHDKSVSSVIVGTVHNEKIQLWIIILCIIIGILLIAAIVMGLVKAGFFKRTKKEELMALKHSEN